MEVGEVREDEGKLETTRKASVEKNDGCRLIVVP